MIPETEVLLVQRENAVLKVNLELLDLLVPKVKKDDKGLPAQRVLVVVTV